MQRARQLRRRIPERRYGGAAQGRTRGLARGLRLSRDFERVLSASARLSPSGPLAVGFSGGGDSTALLYLLADLAGRDERPLHALIVDHGLRPDSAGEAERAAATAEKLGARPRVLRWEDPRPGQAAARRARHRLLARACRDAGAGVLFLAHTLEDRVETLRMRLARPGGWRGLASMAVLDPSPAWPEGRGIALARPLLDARRADLRAFLRDRGAEWIEDPSNDDTRYERVRWRARLDPDAAANRRLLALSDAALKVDAAARACAAGLIADGARFEPWGGARLDARVLAHADEAVAARAMETLVMAVSGEPGGPSPEQTADMLEALATRRGHTAAGAMLTAEAVIGRDPGAAAGRAEGTPGAAALRLAPGETGVFDGRFEIAAGAEPVIASAAGGRREARDSRAPAALRPGLPAATPDSRRDLRVSLLDYDARVRFLGPERCAHLLVRKADRAWFDGAECGDPTPRTGEAGVNAHIVD